VSVPETKVQYNSRLPLPDTFFFVVFDVVGVDLGVGHLAGVDLQQQLFLLFFHAVDVFDLARLSSFLFLAFNQLLPHLRLQSRDSVTSRAVAIANIMKIFLWTREKLVAEKLN